MNSLIASAWAREASAARRAFELLRQAWAAERPAWLVTVPQARPRVRIELAADPGHHASAPLDLSSWPAVSPEPTVDAAGTQSAAGQQTSEIGPWYNVSADTVFGRFDWRSPEDQQSESQPPPPDAAGFEQVSGVVAGSNSAAPAKVVPTTDAETQLPFQIGSFKQGGDSPSAVDASAEPPPGGESITDAFADFDWK